MHGSTPGTVFSVYHTNSEVLLWGLETINSMTHTILEYTLIIGYYE
jgi:hypothetical protein